jgi:hypothetical protein
MSIDLRISDTFTLPVDAATDSSGILAKKGAGKSNAAVVLAEELHDAGVPFVAVDPKGDWWGIRSSKDGNRAGLPVVVFGGKHGDVPLEPTGGALVADLILGDDDRGYLSCVLDVSQFTITDPRRFLLDFGERLFRQKDEERVLHLFLEEAHEYLPQSVPRDATRLVSTWQRIVKQGRFKGLGVTVVSQRSAALNKDVLTQVDSLFVLRTMSPQDRAAVKGWVEVHAGASDILRTLHELAPGEAWLWSPERLDEPTRFRFRQRRTFDSGATPKVGEVRALPRTLADVDLSAVKEAMADTIEKAKAKDPSELRRRIVELEKLLAASEGRLAEPVIERVEVEVITDEQIARLEGAAEGFDISLRALGDKLAADVTPLLVILNRLAHDRGMPDDYYPQKEQGTPTRVEAIQRGSSAPRRPQQSPGDRITPCGDAPGRPCRPTRQGRARHPHRVGAARRPDQDTGRDPHRLLPPRRRVQQRPQRAPLCRADRRPRRPHPHHCWPRSIRRRRTAPDRCRTRRALVSTTRPRRALDPRPARPGMARIAQ